MQGYRYFRIVQTGPNSYVAPQDKTDMWSNVMVLSNFDIFGTLIGMSSEELADRRRNRVKPKKTQTPEIIKADPKSTQEILEILHNALRKDMPNVNVEVHDIML